MKIDVVIPTLNAGETIGSTLQCLSDARDSGLIADVIICDGGSSDGTAESAKIGAQGWHRLNPVRGTQLAAGAVMAKSPWLLFLHADTRLTKGWEKEASDFICREASEGAGAAFSFALDDASLAARGLEWYVKWRCRLAGLPYGDQGLIISRKHCMTRSEDTVPSR